MSHRQKSRPLGIKAANLLAIELARANTHLHFFRDLEAERGFPIEIKDFWDYTLTAHFCMALLQISRVFDTHEKGVNLIQLLRSIIGNNLTTDQAKQLAEYVSFLENDTVVKKFQKWRHNIIAHYNLKIAISGRDKFWSDYPLSLSEAQQMIDSGFKIVEWFSTLYGGSGNFQKLPELKNGHKFVAEHLRKIQ